MLENPAEEAPPYVYQRTTDPEKAPDTPRVRRDRVRARRRRQPSTASASPPPRCSTHLNEIGGEHGVGRLDLVENRFVGMKSRGVYETPGGTILLDAHRGIEQITIDRGCCAPQDELMPKYAEQIYNGFWFSPEREMLQTLIDKQPGARQRHRPRQALQGQRRRRRPHVRPHSLYSESHVTFEDDAGAYDQKDAAGFIKINALRLRLLGMRNRR